eukprot:3855011-Pyramimonas_sp.AAC.1
MSGLGEWARPPHRKGRRRGPRPPPSTLQEGKEHTDTIHRRFPRKHGEIWEVGAKTETQNTWGNMGSL